MNLFRDISTEVAGKRNKIFLLFMALVTVLVAFLFSEGLESFAVLLVVGGIGSFVAWMCLVKTYYAFYVLIVISFFAFFPDRLLGTSLPVSTGIEVLLLLHFVGTLIQYGIREGGGLLKTPISVILIIFFFFLLVQFFNPDAGQNGGWLFFMRRYTGFMLIYIISYRIINTREKLKYYIKFWVVMSMLAALYGCYQQFFGLMPFEMRDLLSKPEEFGLYMQGGLLRKFSFLSDPVTFGVLCGSMAILTLIFALRPQPRKKKALLFLATFIFAMGMSFSGTRTTTIMIPAGVALYSLMTITNRRTLILVFSFIMLVLFILYAPISNPVIDRIRSTFYASNDASLNVRDINRRYIQPYIHEHPIGGGLMTTGTPGILMNPDHPLAGFPPDSGFLLSALEIGWLGFLIYILMNFFIIYQGIHFYFRIRDPEMRVYLIGLVCALFPILITQFSQVTVGQMPSVIFIYSVMSLFTRMREFGEAADKETKEETIQNDHTFNQTI